MFWKLFTSRGGVRVRQSYPGHLLLIALKSEGKVPGEYQPVVVLHHQHLAEEPLPVLLDAALVEGNLEGVVRSPVSVIVTILRSETVWSSVQLIVIRSHYLDMKEPLV